MGSATGLTAAEMENIRNGVIVEAQIDGNGYLILTKHDGSTINAGFAKGSATAETANPTPSTLARRDPSGRTKFANPVDAQDAATKVFVEASATALVPPGCLMDWAGASTAVPSGWLLCDGRAVSRTTYAALFGAIGTLYGSGDGSSTFNLPDKRGRVTVARNSSDPTFTTVGETGGTKTVTLTQAQMPSHTHLQNAHNHTQNSHNHTQNAHNHTQNAHDHTVAAHVHSQSSHDHASRASGHQFTALSSPSNDTHGWLDGTGRLSAASDNGGSVYHTTTAASGGHNVNSATTNPAANTAVNVEATATNNATTATNNATTAVNQSTGGGGAHNNLQPYLVVGGGIIKT